MKKLFICHLSLFLLMLATIPAEGQELFQRVFGGNGYDSGSEIIQKADGNYLIAGSSGSYDVGKSSQIILMEVNELGYEEWHKTYGGQFADQAESIVEDADGNFVIAGFTETIENSYQAYALKVNSAGDTIWTRNYGGASWDFFRQAVALSDGGFALFGQTYSNGAGEGDFYLVRINSEGDTLWTRTYGGIEDESGHAISLTAANGFYLTGNTRSYGNGGYDGYIIKTDEFGDTIWTRTIGGPEDEFCYGATTTFDDGIVAVGGSFSNSPGEADFMRYKLSAQGDSVRARIEDGSTDEYWTDVVEHPVTKSLAMCGWVNDSGFGKTDMRFMRVDQNLFFDGVAYSLGSQENDLMFDITNTADNGYIMVGVSSGFLGRFDDIYVYKTNESGEIEQPELSVDEIVIGNEVFDVMFYPNPAEEQTTFQIEGYESVVRFYNEQLSLTLMNSIGQLVGEHLITSDKTAIGLNTLDDGLYFYQLKSGTEVLTTGKVLKVSNH